MTPPSVRDSRPLTDRELASLADYLAADMTLHLDQQRALVAEVFRLRATTPLQARGGVRPSLPSLHDVNP